MFGIIMWSFIAGVHFVIMVESFMDRRWGWAIFSGAIILICTFLVYIKTSVPVQ